MPRRPVYPCGVHSGGGCLQGRSLARGHHHSRLYTFCCSRLPGDATDGQTQPPTHPCPLSMLLLFYTVPCYTNPCPSLPGPITPSLDTQSPRTPPKSLYVFLIRFTLPTLHLLHLHSPWLHLSLSPPTSRPITPRLDTHCQRTQLHPSPIN